MNKQLIEIFEFKDAALYLKAYLKSLSEEKLHGEHGRLAKAMGIFPSYLSLLLKQERNCNGDQAFALAKYLGLTPLETKYLLRLVELQRATTKALRANIEAEISEIKKTSQQLTSRVSHEKLELSNENLVRYFSDWLPGAVHLAMTIPDCQEAPKIAARLGISLERCLGALSFLLENGLCKKQGSQYQSAGPEAVLLDPESPLMPMRRNIWRQKAIEQNVMIRSDTDLAYNLLCCLSHENAQKIRSLLLESFQQVGALTNSSASETLFLLNLDWFELKAN